MDGSFHYLIIHQGDPAHHKHSNITITNHTTIYYWTFSITSLQDFLFLLNLLNLFLTAAIEDCASCQPVPLTHNHRNNHWIPYNMASSDYLLTICLFENNLILMCLKSYILNCLENSGFWKGFDSKSTLCGTRGPNLAITGCHVLPGRHPKGTQKPFKRRTRFIQPNPKGRYLYAQAWRFRDSSQT